MKNVDIDYRDGHFIGTSFIDSGSLTPPLDEEFYQDLGIKFWHGIRPMIEIEITKNKRRAR